MRSSKADAGSSLGSWGTSWPREGVGEKGGRQLVHLSRALSNRISIWSASANKPSTRRTISCCSESGATKPMAHATSVEARTGRALNAAEHFLRRQPSRSTSQREHKKNEVTGKLDALSLRADRHVFGSVIRPRDDTDRRVCAHQRTTTSSLEDRNASESWSFAGGRNGLDR